MADIKTQDLITKSLVQHDTIDALEQRLGRQLDYSSTSEGLVMLRQSFLDNQAKEAWLKKVGDTTFSMEWHEYFLFVTGLGFKVARNFSLYDPANGHHSHDDVFFFYREDGLMLVTDTYSYEAGGKQVCHRNGATLYFALKPRGNPAESAHHLHGVSYGWESDSEPNWRRTYEEGMPADCVLVGDLDAREALAYNIRRLTVNFDPLPVWPKARNDGLALLRFNVERDFPRDTPMTTEQRSAHIDRIARTRIRALPPELRSIINMEV